MFQKCNKFINTYYNYIITKTSINNVQSDNLNTFVVHENYSITNLPFLKYDCIMVKCTKQFEFYAIITYETRVFMSKVRKILICILNHILIIG